MENRWHSRLTGAMPKTKTLTWLLGTKGELINGAGELGSLLLGNQKGHDSLTRLERVP